MDHGAADVHLILPEMFDVDVAAQEIALRTINKYHGDFSVQCKRGALSLEKVRGENITLACGSADVTVSKLLEGSAKVGCRSFSAKMVNGDNVQIKTMTGVDIGALYVKNVHINAASDGINLGAVHGNVNLELKKGPVKLKSLDGSATILAHSGNVSLQANKLHQGTTTHLEARSGSVEVMADPSIEAQLHCQKIGASSRNSVDVSSENFQGDVTDSGADGVLVGRDESAPGSDVLGGKINLRAASQQSLRTHEQEESDDAPPRALDELPRIEVRASGHIRVETTSWIDNIRRKYFAEGEGTLKTHL